MRKLDDSFTSTIKDTDECVKISCIRTRPIENANEVNKYGVLSPCKSFQISTGNFSMNEIQKQSFRSLDSTTNIAIERRKPSVKIGEKPNPLAPLDNLSFLNQTIIANNLQARSKIVQKINRNYHTEAEIEDDINDEDTADTLTLRKNLDAKILTKGKDCLFNDKIQQFNDDKNKSFVNSSITTQGRPTVQMYIGTYRMATDGMPQGPKNYFTTEINSPKPKDNSLDEINDILFDNLSDYEANIEDSLNETDQIPEKDYIEITEAFERNETKFQMSSPDKRLFSRGNDDDENCDYINLLASDERKKSTTPRQVKEGDRGMRFLQHKIEKIRSLQDPSEALIKAIFDHNVDSVLYSIKNHPEIINQQDALGNTPIMLCTKLAYKHLDYFPIIKCLMSHGADLKIKDPNGWSCLDEIVCQSDVMLLSAFFDQLTYMKKKKLADQQEKLINMLKLTPNFYLEMKWDFESSIIPFFSRLAPSDTFKIWKYDKYLRMDSTLAGFKRLSTKRRDMTLLFNPDVQMPKNYKAAGNLYNINRSKNQYTNPLQDVDLEEKKYMMYDMLKAEPLQGTFNIKGCNWHENKGLFGNTTSQRIGGEWDTRRFDFKLDLEYALFKKSKAFFKDTYENYKTKLMNAKALPAEKVFNKDAREILTQIKQRNGTSSSKHHKNASKTQEEKKNQDPANYMPFNKINLDTFENASVTEKKAEASIWLAQNFPIKFDTLFPVIKFLSNGNNLLQRMESLLSREEVKNLITQNSFPVKIQVPVTLAVKANITITKYELIQNPKVKELFTIPENFKYVDRKDAQKTLLRTKKRMVLVNLLT